MTVPRKDKLKIIDMLSQGHTIRETAEKFNIAKSTVQTIKNKMKGKNMTEDNSLKINEVISVIDTNKDNQQHVTETLTARDHANLKAADDPPIMRLDDIESRLSTLEESLEDLAFVKELMEGAQDITIKRKNGMVITIDMSEVK